MPICFEGGAGEVMLVVEGWMGCSGGCVWNALRFARVAQAWIAADRNPRGVVAKWVRSAALLRGARRNRGWEAGIEEFENGILFSRRIVRRTVEPRIGELFVY